MPTRRVAAPPPEPGTDPDQLPAEAAHDHDCESARGPRRRLFQRRSWRRRWICAANRMAARSSAPGRGSHTRPPTTKAKSRNTNAIGLPPRAVTSVGAPSTMAAAVKYARPRPLRGGIPSRSHSYCRVLPGLRSLALPLQRLASYRSLVTPAAAMRVLSGPASITSTTLQPPLYSVDLSVLISWPLLLIFVPLTSTPKSCILILLFCPSHQCTSERARAVKIIRRSGGGRDGDDRQRL